MNNSIHPVFLLLALAVTLAAVGSIVVYLCRSSVTLARWKLVFSIAPSSLLLFLFYSLAIHMHQSLGSWPTSIGERGFPSGLLAHSIIATNYFVVLLLGTLFVWPVAFLACLWVRSWRHLIVCLSVHALAFALCVGLMQLAPSPFLYWWRD